MPESDCTLNIETKDKEVLKENIQMLKLTTPKKVSKDSSTATVQVMGDLSGIANDKFVVNLLITMEMKAILKLKLLVRYQVLSEL